MPAASRYRSTAVRRDAAAASTVAQANAVVLWPEGNDWLGGTATSASGFTYRTGGRARSKTSFRRRDVTSAVRTAASSCR